MSVVNTIKTTKFQIKYANNQGTYTYAGIKNSGVTDANILATAQAFASIQKYPAEKFFKIVDSNLEDSSS